MSHHTPQGHTILLCSPLLPPILDTSQIPLFWDCTSVFFQWYTSVFTVDNEHYNCAEHYMMSEKAKLFGDTATRRDSIASSDPAQQNRLGRSVSNCNQGLWERHRYGIVYKGNFAKFSTPSFRQQLLDIGDKFLAGASPYDLVWGIGFRAADWQALRPQQWRGLNLLGDILMKIRR